MGLYALFGGEKVEITDVSEYEKILSEYTSENTGVQTGYIVFPEVIPESASETTMYFMIADTWDEPACEFELQCTYSKEDYEKEIERLKNTSKTYEAETRTLLYQENTYNYPAYVAVDANAHTYEYALLSGENQITYVLLSVLSKVHLDGEYMPLEYEKEDNLISGIWDYSIYLISEEKEGDMIVSRDYDFSREEQTEVLKYHYEMDGYNTFYVNTVVGADGKETIKNCSYNYFKNRKDAMYGLPEKKIYEDLEGCRLVKLELDTEQKIATVTYEKNGETGTWTCNYEE